MPIFHRAVLALALVSLPQDVPEPRSVESLLAQTRAFARTGGDLLWPGYGSTPFGLLLVEENHETLYCQAPPSGFTALPVDPTTGCDVARRPRSRLPMNLLAAMPVFGPPSTIVVGTPATTGRSPQGWTRTLLHEHFHQWQSNLPDYYSRVEALGLSQGDQTGMWMLNYPAPYTDARVVEAHAAASAALAAAIAARGGPHFAEAVRAYLEARDRFKESMAADSWRYVEFQLWQEGVARWTEIVLGKAYPDPAVQTSALALEDETLNQLGTPDLAGSGRVFAYAFGAGEAMVLEACDPHWRERYADDLALGPRWSEARCETP